MKKEIIPVQIDSNTIKEKIYFIRGQKVMLDKDLAEIYGYEVKRFNEQVNRNIDRFDEDFMFKLTQEEYEILKSQFATSSSHTLLGLIWTWSLHQIYLYFY